MADDITIVAGIPIPSTSPIFLTGVALHVAFGLFSVVTGAAAMLSRKGRGRHSRLGTLYFWSLAGVFATASGLAFARWTENAHLFALGVLAFGSALLGRRAAQRCWPAWPRWHLVGMGASYVVMLIAFYVDNGPNLPLWKELPPLAHWILPALIGAPIMALTLLRHPLTRRARPGAG